MTCEVFILNRRGVGIASDSAATGGFDLVRRDGTVVSVPKIRNSATKVFPLGGAEGARIAVSIYGKTDISGCPVETLFSGFSGKVSGKKVGSVKEYLDSFVSYCEKEAKKGGFGRGVDAGVEDFTDILCNRILGREAKKGKELFETGVSGKRKGTLLDDLRGDLEKAKKLGKPIPGFSEKMRKLPKDIAKSLEESIDLDFPKNGDVLKRKLSAEERGLVREIALEILRRRGPWDGELVTGIVFSGYGDNSLFPEIRAFETTGIFGGKLRMWIDSETSGEIIPGRREGLVAPFGQASSVKLFMEGISPELWGLHRESMERAMDSLKEELSEIARKRIIPALPLRGGNTPALRAKERERYSKARRESEGIVVEIEKAVFGAYSSHMGAFDEARAKGKPADILENVDGMGVSDLGRLAETLVTLEAAGKKFSSEIESVGGPIDVATIDPGRGFRWMKRKE